jgi:hypothetical protein
MNHEKLYKEAMKAINAVHGDMSVPLSTTLELLVGLKDELVVLIDAVKTSIEMEEQ